MTNFSRRSVVFGAGLSAGLAVAGPAFALTLDEAKASGAVGEMPNGYIGVVQDGSGVQALVDDINARRRARYQEIADSNGVPLAAVEQEAGQQLIGRAGPGEFVLSGNSWARR